MRTTRVMMFLVVLAATSAVRAQYLFTSTTLWEVSTDNGATWQAGSVTVPQTTPHVLARMSVSWTPATVPNGWITWFRDAVMDIYVSDVGTNDNIDILNTRVLFNGQYYVPGVYGAVAVRRVGNYIKLDHPNDMELPGVGSGWIASLQGWSATPTSYSNPVTIYQLQLDLDGTPGQRTFGAAFRQWPPPAGVTDTIRIGVGTSSNPTFHQVVANTQYPASVTVIPALGAPAVLGVALVCGITRRSRQAGELRRPVIQ